MLTTRKYYYYYYIQYICTINSGNFRNKKWLREESTIDTNFHLHVMTDDLGTDVICLIL